LLCQDNSMLESSQIKLNWNYARPVHVYETDLMGIVHHSNYLRFCEEARVEWCYDFISVRESVFGLTVVSTKMEHKWPLRYRDQMTAYLQVKTSGPRVIFQYQIYSGLKTEPQSKLSAIGETIHCRLQDETFKPQRLSPHLIEAVQKYEKESPWIATWL
jgi:acyl-CoA thioester hydrolase